MVRDKYYNALEKIPHRRDIKRDINDIIERGDMAYVDDLVNTNIAHYANLVLEKVLGARADDFKITTTLHDEKVILVEEGYRGGADLYSGGTYDYRRQVGFRGTEDNRRYYKNYATEWFEEKITKVAEKAVNMITRY